MPSITGTLKSAYATLGRKEQKIPSQNTFQADYNPSIRQVKANLQKWEKSAQGSTVERENIRGKIAHNIVSEIRQGAIPSDEYKLLTACDPDGKIQAVCLLKTPATISEASIDQIVTSPKSSAKGSGSFLRKAAEAYARDAGYEKMTLIPYNNAVQDIYKKDGYRFQRTANAPNGTCALDLQA